MTAAAFSAGLVPCPRCGKGLQGVASGQFTCPHCRGAFQATVFEPPRLAAAVRRMAEAGPDGATACPLHEGNAAVAECERCGTYACDLCRMEVEGRTLCPSCFERLTAAGQLEATSTRARDWGGMASALSLLSVLTCIYFGVVLGPAAMYLAWRAREDRLRRGEPPGLWWASASLGALAALGQAVVLVAMVFGLTEMIDAAEKPAP